MRHHSEEHISLHANAIKPLPLHHPYGVCPVCDMAIVPQLM